MKKYYMIAPVLLSFIAISLSACVKDDNTASDDKQTGLDDGQTQVEAQKFSSLSIGHACIGCGHCYRDDPAHFSQASGSRQAIVISQENLETKALENAIRRCPVAAIIRS